MDLDLDSIPCLLTIFSRIQHEWRESRIVIAPTVVMPCRVSNSGYSVVVVVVVCGSSNKLIKWRQAASFNFRWPRLMLSLSDFPSQPFSTFSTFRIWINIHKTRYITLMHAFVLAKLRNLVSLIFIWHHHKPSERWTNYSNKLSRNSKFLWWRRVNSKRMDLEDLAFTHHSFYQNLADGRKGKAPFSTFVFSPSHHTSCLIIITNFLHGMEKLLEVKLFTGIELNQSDELEVG